MNKNYYFSKEEFKKMYKNVEEIYSLLTIINYYCSKQKYIEELKYLSPIIKYLFCISDNIYNYFIKTKFKK